MARGDEEIGGCGTEVMGELGHVFFDPFEPAQPRYAPFIHVECSIYLNLHGVEPLGGASIVLGIEATGVGIVSAD